MSISRDTKPTPVATNVVFDEHQIMVALADGRMISAPLEWFPKLREATASQRKAWRLIGGGARIHWEDLDEDISVEGLLAA